MKEKLFQKYCSLCTRTVSGIHDRKRVPGHNRAMAGLAKLAAKINDVPELADEVFGQLLQVPDPCVQVHAAVHCLKYGRHTEQAVRLLEQIMQEGNPYLALNAEISLKVWRGEIPGKKL